MKDHVHNLKETFWDRAGDARAVLMEIDGRAVPMSPYADKDEGVIWFITAEGTDAQTAANGAGTVRLIYGDSGAKLYGTVEGSLTQADNSAKLDELWSPVAAAWFEDGREDDDVRLLWANMDPSASDAEALRSPQDQQDQTERPQRRPGPFCVQRLGGAVQLL